ncbi:EutN/CcmL family microcompartment protein [Blastopirellula sp. JC732]|uniref:EutN/CcmL family microcompartment protein n=1 Tax=Blastopirellula sediminis TaxID=2894196 RepID=A0A9X1MJ10_9BACT|nr:EutN/CcmL family microcompartment protein [Blastopirellula sediminis]MCC9609245.1 EutN/CcmL family microcompartment protein [Blastopirellula sediminis]MCC9627978.1 EutN/CcmL family microcompartment protein [Blastopirellula sediminis]
MFIAKVTGSVIATQKVDSMVGNKLLVVEPYRLEPKDRKTLVTTGRTFIAVDMLGSGVGDFVLITQGSSARLTPETKSLPIDCVVVGIVDQAHIDQACVYSREDAPAEEQPPVEVKPPVEAKKAKPKAAPKPKPEPEAEPTPEGEPETDADATE